MLLEAAWAASFQPAKAAMSTGDRRLGCSSMRRWLIRRSPSTHRLDRRVGTAQDGRERPCCYYLTEGGKALGRVGVVIRPADILSFDAEADDRPRRHAHDHHFAV